MDFKSWPDKLAEALLNKPRAAFGIGAVAVIVWLASVITGLVIFIKSQNSYTLNNNSAEIKRLNTKLDKLESQKDSLVNLVGEVRAEGLREKIALQDVQNAELSAFNKAYRSEKDAMAQELKELRAAANRNNKLSEIQKNSQTQ